MCVTLLWNCTFMPHTSTDRHSNWCMQYKINLPCYIYFKCMCAMMGDKVFLSILDLNEITYTWLLWKYIHDVQAGCRTSPGISHFSWGAKLPSLTELRCNSFKLRCNFQHMSDTIKGNESHVEDFKFWDFYTTFWQLKNATLNPIRIGYLVAELWAIYKRWNIKQRNLNAFFAYISKTISVTSTHSPWSCHTLTWFGIQN